ncbi:MAG: site-specific integrase [Pseudomonadota bacterium]
MHTEIGHLRSCLRWSAKIGRINRAPHLENVPKPDSDVNPLSMPELRRLLDNCRSAHTRLAVLLLFSTTARVGAVLDLTWDRIDFERGIIDLRLLDGVTRKGRAVVPMNSMIRPALKTACDSRICDHVIEHNGKPIGSIRTAYKNALRRAKLHSITFHQIRHTAAIMMLESGIDIEQVSQFFGHSNSQITRRTYARFTPEAMQPAADVLVLPVFQDAQKG